MSRSKLNTVGVAAAVAVMIQFASAAGHAGHKTNASPNHGPCVDQEAACKVCVPVPDKKKMTKVVYECKEEWYCLPKCPCPLHVGKHSCCEPSGTACPTCEKPRCRRVLVKRIITEEKPSTKCVVETVTERVP